MLEIIASSEKIEKTTAQALAFLLFEGEIESSSTLSKIDESLAGLISETLKKEGFKAKPGEAKVFHTHHKIKPTYVVILGMGPIKKFDLETLRKATGKLVQTLEAHKIANASFFALETCDKLDQVDQIAEAVTEAAQLAAYRFTRYKTKKEDTETSALKKLMLVLNQSSEKQSTEKGIRRANCISEATAYARDLTNIPSADKPPEFLAKEAKKIAGIETKVHAVPSLKKMGMGGILGVGQGSKFPPVLIEMIYRPSKKPKKKIALVGKGVTFDSGGLSLKPPKSMETMKDDMSAAAVVLAVMKTLKQLEIPIEVHGYVPSAENMPGGGAMRPGDVLTMYNKKTVEVLNTDAEGRLILADALSYAATKKPDFIIDIATLTGACLVALGELYAAVLGTDAELIGHLIKAGKKSGERIWELPLVDEYREEIKSPIADIQNIGGNYGGTINGALFLQEFVGDLPWIHFDIAGPSWANKPWAYGPKGGTGFLVRTLCRFLQEL